MDQFGSDARRGNTQAATVRSCLGRRDKSLARDTVVVPLSTSPQDAPPVVVSVPSAGIDSVAVVDQIRAVDRARFVSKQGKLSDTDMSVLEKALKRVLELP